MKVLPKFEYVAPTTVNDLCQFLKDHGGETRILAGGTDLLISLKKGEETPKYVVDITRIRELSSIRDEQNRISIGATVTHTEVSESALVLKEVPLLTEAAASIGSVQIRNSGTIGGNVMNASPAGDTIPPLVALDATVRIMSHKGERHALLKEIFSGPYSTMLSSDEFLTDITFTKLSSRAGTCFLKLGRRRALAISRISIAVILVTGKDGRIQEARICPGAVLPSASRIVKAEAALQGAYPGVEVFEEVGRIVAKEMVARSGRRFSTPYKEPVVNNLVQRALLIAAGRCRKDEAQIPG
jgi:carbon-monoxide dehydrogenase medium subunit/xanthine dehydrogenase FAD-binding subunit